MAWGAKLAEKNQEKNIVSQFNVDLIYWEGDQQAMSTSLEYFVHGSINMCKASMVRLTTVLNHHHGYK